MTLYQELEILNLKCPRCHKITNFSVLIRRGKHIILRCKMCNIFKRGDLTYCEENLEILREKSRRVKSGK